jgi:hypothetical protein
MTNQLFAAMSLIGMSAIAALWLAAQERRRGTGQHSPVRLHARARRYSHP